MASLREIAAEFDFSGNFQVLTDLQDALNTIIGQLEKATSAIANTIEIPVDTEELEEASDVIEKTDINLLKFIGTAGKAAAKYAAIGAAAGAAAVTGLFLFTKGIADSVDELADAAVKSGTSIENYQLLSFAVQRAGINLAELKPTLEKVNTDLAKAGNAADGMTQAYKALGIEMTNADGTARDSTAVLDDIRKAYQADPVKNAAKAQQLLGGSFAKMLPYLMMSNEEIEKNNLIMTENGLITKEQQEASGAFNDSLDDLKYTLFSVGATIMQVLAPAFEVGIQMFKEIIKFAKSFFSDLSGDTSVKDWSWLLVEYMILAWNAVVNFVNTGIKAFKQFRDFIKNNTDEINKSLDEFMQTVEDLTPILAGLAAMITTVLISAYGKLLLAIVAQNAAMIFTALTAIPAVLAGFAKMVIAQALLLATNPFTYIVIGIGLVVAAIVWLAQNWDDVWNGIRDTFYSVWDSISDYFREKFNSIISQFNTLKSLIPGISKLVGDIPEIKLATKVSADKMGPGNGESRTSITENMDIKADTNVGDINIYGADVNSAAGVGAAVKNAIPTGSGNAQKAAEKFKKKRG